MSVIKTEAARKKEETARNKSKWPLWKKERENKLAAIRVKKDEGQKEVA